MTVVLLFAGDLGYLRKDGLVVIADRLKDLIKYKGFQVCREPFFFWTVSASLSGFGGLATMLLIQYTQPQPGGRMPSRLLIPHGILSYFQGPGPVRARIVGNDCFYHI